MKFTGMKILAIDLGKRRSVFCDFVVGGRAPQFGSITMQREEVSELLEQRRPDRLVVECGSSTGWVHDLAESMGIEVEVANTNHELFRSRRTRNKTDRNDAKRLATLSAMEELPLVHMPTAEVRRWRAMITFRRTLVDRRTRIKNDIRAILDREGMSMPKGKSGWTKATIKQLRAMAEDSTGEAWRLMLRVELDQLAAVEASIVEVEEALERMAATDKRVALLRTAPSIGARASEAIVATIDDPHRFTRGRDVGAYVGLTPRKFQSGDSDRDGRISGAGNPVLRSLLVEVSWLGVSRLKVPWMVELFERICRGSKKRRKIAIVAVARRLVIRCWAMLRDSTPWRHAVEAPKPIPQLRLTA